MDKKLHLKIINSGIEGVLNWIIEGAKRVLEQEDIFISNKCEKAKKEFMKELDNVQMFIEENGYRPSIHHRIKAKDLYGEYKNYCINNTFRSVSSTTFKKRLQSYGIEWKRGRDTSYYLIEKE